MLSMGQIKEALDGVSISTGVDEGDSLFTNGRSPAIQALIDRTVKNNGVCEEDVEVMRRQSVAYEKERFTVLNC